MSNARSYEDDIKKDVIDEIYAWFEKLPTSEDGSILGIPSILSNALVGFKGAVLGMGKLATIERLLTAADCAKDSLDSPQATYTATAEVAQKTIDLATKLITSDYSWAKIALEINNPVASSLINNFLSVFNEKNNLTKEEPLRNLYLHDLVKLGGMPIDHAKSALKVLQGTKQSALDINEKAVELLVKFNQFKYRNTDTVLTAGGAAILAERRWCGDSEGEDHYLTILTNLVEKQNKTLSDAINEIAKENVAFQSLNNTQKGIYEYINKARHRLKVRAADFKDADWLNFSGNSKQLSIALDTIISKIPEMTGSQALNALFLVITNVLHTTDYKLKSAYPAADEDLLTAIRAKFIEARDSIKNNKGGVADMLKRDAMEPMDPVKDAIEKVKEMSEQGPNAIKNFAKSFKAKLETTAAEKPAEPAPEVKL